MKRESFIQKSISNYGNVYDYSLIPEKVDLNDGSIIEINCERHGIFQLRPDKHLYDNRECPICKESKGEIEISSYLKDNGIEYKREVDFDNLKGTGGGN
jgi:hypothetical protein